MSERYVCAVTGASGYVGSRLVARLAETFDVIPVGRRVDEASISWSIEGPSIEEQLRGKRVRVLVHAAWDFNHPKAADNWKVNVEGSRRLISEAKAAGVVTILFISSISSFRSARSEYGKSKFAVEEMVLQAGGIVIRPGLVWGNSPGGVFGALKKQAAQDGIVPMIGSGRYPQFLVHEDDLAEAVRCVARSPEKYKGRIVTLAQTEPWLLIDLIRAIASRKVTSLRFVHLPWRIVFMGLKSAEFLGLKLGFRSDSLISLIYGNSAPEFTEDIPVRSFTP